MRSLVILLVAALASAAHAEPFETVTLDLARTRFALARAAKTFAPRSAREGTLAVALVGSLTDRTERVAELAFDLAGTPLARRRWGDRTAVRAEVRVSPELVGEGKRNWYRAHRARLFLEDGKGRRQFLPHAPIVDRPALRDGWLPLSGRPTVALPIPLGFTDDGFDPDGVTRLGLSVEAFARDGEAVTGTVELRDLRVSFGAPVAPRVLPVDPAIAADETARAQRMDARWRARFGASDAFVRGVNLAWAAARSPDGEVMQLYGRLLDAGAKWYGAQWDLGEPRVARAVRDDLRAIAAAFGPRPIVRVFLFGDLRGGVRFDTEGTPLEISARAHRNMGALLRLARAEGVVLIPVLLDFTMADGIEKTGPNGTWVLGEHLDLVTDPRKRAALVTLLERFVRAFTGHPAVLAWEVMNEPENAAAAVTAEHFAHLQQLLADGAAAIGRAGELATVGHRSPVEAARFFRGRLATHLGQAHHYPLADTRPNPIPFDARLDGGFGPLPSGWGEAQLSPGGVAAAYDAVRAAGHRYLLFWSWRGHDDTGDGFAVAPYADEIRAARPRPR